MGFSVDTRIILCYIESHIKEIMDKEELIKMTGFSMAYIREFFKKNTGCSLAKYILERKISSSMFELIHTKMKIIDIAFLYGFSSHESYTRAFYRVVKITPSDFRKKNPIVGKKELTAGIFGIGFLEKKEKRSDISMKGNYDKDHNSTILYNVPNVGFGTYGGCTPFPICLKACLDYLGEEVEYAFSMVATGAAFRMTWNQETWDLSSRYTHERKIFPLFACEFVPTVATKWLTFCRVHSGMTCLVQSYTSLYTERSCFSTDNIASMVMQIFDTVYCIIDIYLNFTSFLSRFMVYYSNPMKG